MPKRAKIFVIALATCVLFFGLLGKRYYSYATNTESPFDEVGISLHRMMPGPVQTWGCAKLKATFGEKTPPPHGCKAMTGAYGWR